MSLKAGESRKVTFTITPDKLAYYNKDLQYEVELGEFEIMVGSSSCDDDLLKVLIEVE